MDKWKINLNITYSSQIANQATSTKNFAQNKTKSKKTKTFANEIFKKWEGFHAKLSNDIR